jgi:Xaa-Pro dipeptidase
VWFSVTSTAGEKPHERARVAARAAGIDWVLAGSPGLVAFLSGHVIPPHLAFPSRDGRLEKPTLVLLGPDDVVTVGCNPQPAIGQQARYDGAAALNDEPAAFAALARAARSLGLRKGRVAVELSSVPAAAVQALAAVSPDAKIEPLDDLLSDVKAEKSGEEVEGIRAACDLVEVGQREFRSAVSPGATELELYGAVARAMNSRAEGVVLPLSEIQVGPRTELGMGPPTNARLEPGELAICDIAPRHPNGWWADSCSTAACGQPTPEQQRVWTRLFDGLQAGRELLRPNTCAGDVYEAVARFAGEQAGHVGHGIGRDHFEEPIIRRGESQMLPRGSVIVLEPGYYQGGFGIRIEWAFLVTDNGGEPMTSFSLEL